MNEYLKNPFQLTILFALLLPLAVWAEAKKPNIVVLFIDDLGVYDSKVNDLPTGEKL